MGKSFLRRTKEVLILLLASIGYAVGIALFLEPKGLAAGGISGLAIVLSYLTDLNTGIIILVINVPIILVGIYKFGIKFFLSTIFVIFVSSTVIDLCKYVTFPPLDMLCSSVCGSVLIGGAIGVIFRMGATTGGSDIIVRLLRLKFKHIRSGAIFLMLDIFVIALSGIVFRNIEVCVYAGVCVFIEAYIINLILYGINSAELVCIVSENDGISQRIKEELNSDIIRLSPDFIVIAVRKRDTPKVRSIASQEDKNALLTVIPTQEIFGKNFSPLDREEL